MFVNELYMYIKYTWMVNIHLPGHLTYSLHTKQAGEQQTDPREFNSLIFQVSIPTLRTTLIV